MNKFNISDIENLTGIKAHNIRIWEQRYQLLETKRTHTNIRYYDDNDLCYFLNVACLLGYGYKISKVAKMPRNEMETLVADLSMRHIDHSGPIELLTNAAIRLDHSGVEQILQDCINKLGLKTAAVEIFFPFLNKIGCLWQVGSITPSHEHFLSNLIRQKLFASINNTSINPGKEAKKFILFLPDNENHDMGLLLAYFILKQAGHQVLYLGQNMPVSNIGSAADYYKPDYVLTSLTLSQTPESVELINQIGAALAPWPVLISGHLLISEDERLIENVTWMRDFDQFETFIAAL